MAGFAAARKAAAGSGMREAFTALTSLATCAAASTTAGGGSKDGGEAGSRTARCRLAAS